MPGKMRALLGCLMLLASAAGQAQIQTAPLQEAPSFNPKSVVTPPVLPAHPVRPAIQAIASGGGGGLSYSGPSGAMNTSAEGATCTVTCALTLPTVHRFQ